MDIPFTHREPRFTMWSKSPSMVISLPSRTDATMPHPHEQKLQEVVNSAISESFHSCVAARTVGTSRKPPTARPTLLRAAALNHSLREIPRGLAEDSKSSPCIFPISCLASLWFESMAWFAGGTVHRMFTGPVQFSADSLSLIIRGWRGYSFARNRSH